MPFELPQGYLESDSSSLHAWTTDIHIFQYKFYKILKLRAVNCDTSLMLWVNSEIVIDTCLTLFTIFK